MVDSQTFVSKTGRLGVIVRPSFYRFIHVDKSYSMSIAFFTPKDLKRLLDTDSCTLEKITSRYHDNSVHKVVLDSDTCKLTLICRDKTIDFTFDSVDWDSFIFYLHSLHSIAFIEG